MSNQSSINAIRITREISDDANFASEMMEEIEHAAVALDKVEESPGFSWEDQHDDWETICFRIAGAIERGDRGRDWYLYIQKELGIRVGREKEKITVFWDKANDSLTIVFPKGLDQHLDIDVAEISVDEDEALESRGAETNGAELKRLKNDPLFDTLEYP